MPFGPIWRATLRNKTGAILIVLQVAFTMALVLNAVAIAQFNDHVQNDPRTTNVMLTVRDGLLLIRRKS